jgi:hypothetical protein
MTAMRANETTRVRARTEARREDTLIASGENEGCFFLGSTYDRVLYAFELGTA